jgi:hypothetical protein
MKNLTDTFRSRSPIRRRELNTRVSVAAIAITGVALCVVVGLALTSTATPQTITPFLQSRITYPSGTVDSTQPSGEAPPSATALPGYTLSYEHEFTGTSLPAGWYAFSGVPGGDPDAELATTHVVVGGGILALNTWKDPRFKDKWVSGGLCQCGLAQTYGAYFVRSRVTGEGPDEAQLLWPVARVWPPEVDFNETGEGDTSTGATIHYGGTNLLDQRSVDIDMTQWHTWGVIWTPSSITYTVDGQVWGKITLRYEIPDQPMTLHLQQETWCSKNRDCPTGPVSMLVNWVAEYRPIKS